MACLVMEQFSLFCVNCLSKILSVIQSYIICFGSMDTRLFLISISLSNFKT